MSPKRLKYKKALDELLRTLRPEIFRAGEILIRQGDVSDAAYFVQSGSLQVYTETAYGPVPLATLQAPHLIGEIGVLAGLPRTASVRVMADATVFRIGRGKLMEIGRKAPGFLLFVIGQLGRQLDSVNMAVGLYTNAIAALERRAFDPQILDDLENAPPQLAEFAATFRRFAHQILDKRRQQDEIASAAIIQRSLLPGDAAQVAADFGLELYAEMRAARHVGGDFYDIFALDQDRLAISIGDVCGKGIPASLFMAVVVTLLRTLAREEDDLASTVARANTALCRDNTSSMFATYFCCVLNVRTGALDYCNCGHLAPQLLSADGKSVSLAATGVPLGLFADRPPAVGSVTMNEGDVLMLFTDGVTEAMSPLQEEFGDERLSETLKRCRHLPVPTMASEIFAAVDAFAAEAPQADDITCIALRRGPDADV